MYNAFSMAGIVSISKVGAVVKRLKSTGKTIVLAGGCFDILHPGHVVFLEKAKKNRDILIVMLESDEKVRQLKGPNRPVHTQKERALVLKALKSVDIVIPLPFIDSDQQYDTIIQKIKPDIIAATAGDPQNHHKERSAKLVGAKLKVVTKIITGYSTSQILNHY